MERLRLLVDRDVRALCPAPLLRQLVRRILRAGGCMGCRRNELVASLCVRMVGDAAMSELHRIHMGEAKPTDVLSFPARATSAGVAGSLGDIALNWQAVVRQARGSGMLAWLDEATVLCVHGLAHLLGHDHRNRLEGRRMLRLERRGLAAVGVADIPRPYGR